MSTLMNGNRLVANSKYFIYDVNQYMKNDSKLQSEFVRVADSAVPFGLAGRVKANESEHVFNLYYSIIECASKSRAGACFAKVKEKYTSRNSKGADDKNTFRRNLKVKSTFNPDKLKLKYLKTVILCIFIKTLKYLNYHFCYDCDSLGSWK